MRMVFRVSLNLTYTPFFTTFLNLFQPGVGWFPCQVESVPHLLLRVWGVLCSFFQGIPNSPQSFTFSFHFLLPSSLIFSLPSCLPGSPWTFSSSFQVKWRISLSVSSIMNENSQVKLYLFWILRLPHTYRDWPVIMGMTFTPPASLSGCST